VILLGAELGAAPGQAGPFGSTADTETEDDAEPSGHDDHWPGTGWHGVGGSAACRFDQFNEVALRVGDVRVAHAFTHPVGGRFD
jgi:hypothetical protein